MELDKLVFKTVVLTKNASEKFITLRERKGTYILGLSVGTQGMCEELVPNYNGVELLVANESVFAIKPIIKPKGNNQKQFSATVLRGSLKDIRFNKRLFVVMYKDMIVCNLKKNVI